MKEQIELKQLDLRYEHYRLKSPGSEKILIASIVESGIREPLQGVNKEDKRILLNGFKRYRCAKRLGIGIVPYMPLGDDEVDGIIALLRISNTKSLSILEQAILIDELITVYKLCNADIAGLLEKSKSWVSVRAGIIKEMSDLVREKIFNGEFPVYSYMYTLRQFMRINSIGKKEIDEFVGAVSGKNLSLRDIEILANGYFKGGENIRQQIRDGNLLWGLSRLKESSIKTNGCSEIEQKMLKDLEIVQKYMQRVISRSKDDRFETDTFYAQAGLLTSGILRIINLFSKAIGHVYDISGQTKNNLPSTSGGHGNKNDCA